MGATGAGKSTFVNYLVQDEALKSPVGHGLTSCTSELRPIPLCFPNDNLLRLYRITLVDTPGFDDTYVGDAAILQRIADWFANAYREKKVLAGVIYLHDITSKKLTGSALKNLAMFQAMCGEAAFRKVILGTTNWKRTSTESPVSGEGCEKERREKELKDVHWKPMLAKEARTKRFDDSYDSAVSFVKDIL
ncbi:hypothetical protein CPC08DRAFT_671006, partial [Agrocybe pediades]